MTGSEILAVSYIADGIRLFAADEMIDRDFDGDWYRLAARGERARIRAGLVGKELTEWARPHQCYAVSVGADAN